MSDSVDSILNRISRSPQAIPEGRVVDYASSPIASSGTDPFGGLSRNSSTRSFRMINPRPTRISTSRRSSRRSASMTASASPAHAFLSSWANTSDLAIEPQPDDEGQSIGIGNEYIIGRKISQGGFGTVKEVHSINDSGERTIQAVKIVRRFLPDKGETENDIIQQGVEHEVSIWRHLEHPHILELHAVYETDYATFCVMHLNMGKTLFDLVRIARNQRAENDGRRSLPVHMARNYAFQLASALRYLHEDMRICHRDVKLENCLIDMSAADAGRVGGHLRLCDFGLADFLHSDQSADELSVTPSDETRSPGAIELECSSIIGTLEYASPEGLRAGRKLYSTSGDIWAFGVVLYALYTGKLPFRHALPAKTCELILQNEWDTTLSQNLEPEKEPALALIKSCLTKNADARASAGEILENTWFDGFRDGSEDSNTRNW